jgi:Protein of unknown function (DUF2924)
MAMKLNVEKEVAALQRMTANELRERFAEVFGESTNGRNKVWLVRRIAWRLQAKAEGGLSERALKRAAELADEADLRITPPRDDGKPNLTVVPLLGTHDSRLPPPGTVLTRRYKGGLVRVTVLDRGFEHEGETYPTLTAVAKKVTGTHTNGYLFFKLNGKRGAA